MELLADASAVHNRTPLKVQRLDDSSVILNVSAETITFQYNNAGTLASATGQAAGTMIFAKLNYDNVLNVFKDSVGDAKDSSFVFVTGTVLTQRITMPADFDLSLLLDMTVADKFTRIATLLKSNGQFIVDHVNGAIWGKAAAVVANDTANYSVKTPVAGGAGPSGPSSDVNVKQIAGTATATGNGVTGAGSQRVTIASDNTPFTVIANAGTGTFTVDTELPAAAALADATANPTIPLAGAVLEGFNGTTWDRIRAGITAVTATLTGWLNTLPWAIFNTTPTTRTNGQGGPLQADASGNLKTVESFAPASEDNTNGVQVTAIKPIAVNTYSWTDYENFGAAVTANIKASSGNVKALYCHNTNAAARYIQLHDTATTPAGGAVPKFSFLVPATNGTTIIDGQFFGENGKNFTNGIAFGFSTTEGTYTAGVAGDQATIVMYK